MQKLNKDDIRVSHATRRGVARLGAMGLMLAGSMTMSSCLLSDDKSCSDFDTGDGNGSARYDTGVYADANDFGGDYDSGDLSGMGDRCSDFD